MRQIKELQKFEFMDKCDLCKENLDDNSYRALADDGVIYIICNKCGAGLQDLLGIEDKEITEWAMDK